MTKYIKAHEKYILNQIEVNLITENLLSYHSNQISHLAHERLVHLIVMSLFALLLTIFFVLFVFMPILLIGMLLAIFFVTEIFYVAHYYNLENTVQRWYKIENVMIAKLRDVGVNLYSPK